MPLPASGMDHECVPLVEALGALPYRVSGVLGLVVLGLMANGRSLSAISRYGQIHPDVFPPLGLVRSPSVPALSRVLAGVDPAPVRAALLHFTHRLLTARGQVQRVAPWIGTCRRGVHEDAAPADILHVFAHEAGLVLDQLLVPSVRDVATAADQGMTTVAARFPSLTVLTADALDAAQDLCATIVRQNYASLPRLKNTTPPSSRTPSFSSPPSSGPPTPVSSSWPRRDPPHMACSAADARSGVRTRR